MSRNLSTTYNHRPVGIGKKRKKNKKKRKPFRYWKARRRK